MTVDDASYLRLVRQLIQLDTGNPPGAEDKAVQVVGSALRELGFEIQYFEPEPRRTSLVARLRGQGGGRSLILNGHVDTGPLVEGWSKDPWAGVLEGRRLYGHGVGDMKGGVAAMVTAARAVVEAAAPRRGDLVLMIVADETSGGHKGSGYVVRQIAPPGQMAVMCEPARGDFVRIAHRGAVWLEATVTGRSGQGGRPETGVNAIEMTARIITAIYRELAPRWLSRTHPHLPSPSVNVGVISGGVKPNVIPGVCRVQLDRRTLPGERVPEVLEEIRATAEAVLHGTGASARIRELLHVDPGEVDPGADIVRACCHAFEQVTGRVPALTGTGGFTDAHWVLDGWKIPAVSFGPWYLNAEDRSVTGIPDEWIDLDDALTGARVYAQLVLNIVT